MAIIELNLEKPALKRVESGEKRAESNEKPSRTTSVTSDSRRRETTESDADADASPAESSEAPSTDEQADSGGRSRLRTYGRRMAILGGTAAGVVAARKLRQRRQADASQQDLNDEWQTADPTSSSESSTR